MMNPQRLVSVIIPVFNGETHLVDAVDSIRRQEYASVELIVVDDGSSDDTAGAVRRLPQDGLRYVYQENGGPSRARNRGLALAQGDVIGFLDADDAWPPCRLRRQLAVLDRESSIDVVLGQTQLLRPSAGDATRSRFEKDGPPIVFLSPNAALFRRRVFERVGGFDEALRYAEDIDWFMRARELDVPLAVEHDVAWLYRRHERNMTRGRSMRELRVLDVLKRSLDRRRQGGRGAAPLPTLSRGGRCGPDGRGAGDG